MTDLAISMTPPPGPGWVQLPADKPRRGGLGKVFGGSRGEDRELAAWATAQARETSGPDAAPEAVAACAQTLTRLTQGARDRGEKMAFAWFPQPGGAPVAQITVSTFGHPGERPTLDVIEENFAWRDGQTGPLEVERMDLPGGPAVRVRREQATGDAATGGAATGGAATGDAATGDGPSDVAVSVTYAFLPPQMKTALVFTMYWALSDDEPVFTEIADATAKTLRAVRAT